MLSDIESGKVGCVIVKDLSRLGRNAIDTGYYIERYFPSHNVRFISVTDQFDSENPDNLHGGIILPLKNMINEAYALDIGRKIKAQARQDMKEGKYVGGRAPFGYMKDPDDCHKLIIDPVAAPVVRQIFQWAYEHVGLNDIARRLNEQGIQTPSHRKRATGEITHENLVGSGKWQTRTVAKILDSEVYTGDLVQGKTKIVDHQQVQADEDNLIIATNTHEAIIDQETFDNVQRVRGNARRYPDGFGEAYPLTGLMYCADCGGKMYVHRTYNGKRVPQYTCGQYGKYPIGSLCPTQHRIKAEAVLTLIADMLRTIAEYSRNDRAEFIRTVQETQAAQQTADISKKRKRLAAAQKRAGELERLICKIYEDNALGKLPDARYEALDAQYAKEQDALNAEITELEKAVTGYEQSRKSAEKFIALIDKYENFDTLTNIMLNEFVEKILVHERARKGSQDTTQEVEIYFNFVGRYIPPALQPVPLTPEEQEELRKKEERKDRLHQNYLRRKANGKQKEWEERYNAKRKAQREAAKAAIRAEDMEKGIFIPSQSVTQAGAAQGHRIGQCRSLTITVQRRMNMSELTYTRCGDYYIPDLKLSEQPEAPIGKYGRMRQRYLKEHRPGLYSSLILSEKLYPHLLEIDRAARERMDAMLPRMMEAAGVTEELKARDPMRWVGLMNTLKAQAEEIVLDELIMA